MKTKHFLLIVSLIALLSYGVWEYAVLQWLQETAGFIPRVDLVLIWPGLLALISLTGISWLKASKVE